MGHGSLLPPLVTWYWPNTLRRYEQSPRSIRSDQRLGSLQRERETTDPYKSSSQRPPWKALKPPSPTAKIACVHMWGGDALLRADFSGPETAERECPISLSRTLLESNWISDESAEEETLSGKRQESGCSRRKTIREWEAGDSTFWMSFPLKDGAPRDAWQDKQYLREGYSFLPPLKFHISSDASHPFICWSGLTLLFSRFFSLPLRLYCVPDDISDSLTAALNLPLLSS